MRPLGGGGEAGSEQHSRGKTGSGGTTDLREPDRLVHLGYETISQQVPGQVKALAVSGLRLVPLTVAAPDEQLQDRLVLGHLEDAGR